MAFTIEDFRDLIGLLGQHPEWRTELRRWVLSDDLLTLPQTMHELAEAQRRTEEQVGQLAVRMDELAQRMDQLTQRMDQLTQRMDELAQRMDQLTARLEQLVEVQTRMGSDLERLKGSDLERRYRERAHAYFSRLFRRIHVLSGDELTALLEEAITHEQLSEEEADDVLQADVVLRGRRREDGTEVYGVVEVSWGIGLSDVQRASTRATLLARTGRPAVPIVAGFWLTPEAQEPARAFHVWQVTNGRVISPEIA
jgi:predicted nuclease with TOPRIM domain